MGKLEILEIVKNFQLVNTYKQKRKKDEKNKQKFVHLFIWRL